MWNRFWRWYERHYLLNVALASGLFVLQLVHLYWLGADPIASRLVGQSYFHASGAVDYLELPVIVDTFRRAGRAIAAGAGPAEQRGALSAGSPAAPR